MSSEERDSAIQRMLRGAALFLRRFGIYGIPLLVMWLIAGREPVLRGSLPLRVDLLTFIYPIGAAVTGALLGLLEPMADRSRALAMVVGIVAIAPWMAGIASTMDRGYESWSAGHTFVTAIMSVTLGCGLGYGYSRP